MERKSLWIIGGDGWAYDIGFGGLDHVLSTGENVNILVLDTEVYSNTGGQKSKASPIGASAKFSIKGKTTGKKDLAMQAIAHGTAYVAEIAMGANDVHALKTILEAEAYPGPSIILPIAIALPMDTICVMVLTSKTSQLIRLLAVVPLQSIERKRTTICVDCKAPSVQLEEFLYHENRFATIKDNSPEKAEEFLAMANEGIQQRWERIEALRVL